MKNIKIKRTTTFRPCTSTEWFIAAVGLLSAAKSDSECETILCSRDAGLVSRYALITDLARAQSIPEIIAEISKRALRHVKIADSKLIVKFHTRVCRIASQSENLRMAIEMFAMEYYLSMGYIGFCDIEEVCRDHCRSTNRELYGERVNLKLK